jgi:hypothetical protein
MFSVGFKPSKKDDRDYTFGELRRMKETKSEEIDDVDDADDEASDDERPEECVKKDIMKRDVIISMVVSCPVKQIEKVRKSIKSIIFKHDLKVLEKSERVL